MGQSLSKIYTHLVFATKGRAEILPKEHLNEVHAYIAETLNKNGCKAIAVGGTANHIHILYIQSKTMSLSETVRVVKSCSSKWINEHTCCLSFFCWQDGYGAFSISNSHVDDVVRYIQNQLEHHKRVSFEDEFRKICAKYNVALDERYAWE